MDSQRSADNATKTLFDLIGGELWTLIYFNLSPWFLRHLTLYQLQIQDSFARFYALIDPLSMISRMMKRIQFLTIAIFVASGNLFSQSLSIEETINYLNKLSKENQLEHSYSNCKSRGYNEFNLTKDGLMTVYSHYIEYDCKQQKYFPHRIFIYKFYIEDLDIINIDNYNEEESASWKEKSFKLQTKNKYEDIIMNDTLKRWSIGFSTTNHYNRMRYYNAMKYLITSALAQGYRRNDKNDPFVERSDDLRIATNNPSKIAHKIKLNQKNGVFTIDASIGGLLFSFVLDSGAGESNISSGTERQLLTKGIIKQKDYLSNGLYILADGSVQECRRVRIPKITVGGKTVYNVVASIGPGGSPNLLGQSFLSKADSWTIDNTKNYLTLR